MGKRALVAAFAVVGLIVLRLSRRQRAVPVVSELGDELGRVGCTIAAALIAVTLPVQVFLSVLQVLASLEPGGAAARLSFDITPLVTRIVDPSRVLVGVVLIILAVRCSPRPERPGSGSGLHRRHVGCWPPAAVRRSGRRPRSILMRSIWWPPRWSWLPS